MNQEQELFEQALALPSREAREGYLLRACGQNRELRKNVDKLLAAFNDVREMDFLTSGDRAQEAQTVIAETKLPEGPGTVIGRYKLLQQIGEGGMGVVYMAEQEEPVRRRVALKIIKLGMDTRQVVARFEAERQALALMDHPNIARVLDGGATEAGRPYFVMELVQGVPITEFCDKNKLRAKERLKLFIQVCHAIQSAHQKGIIHRDIKPSNVLVTLHHGEPMSKVIDFGIAKATNQKLTEKTLFTHYASMIGTPAYMSPEQAEMSSMDVDTRADVYALGVLLYELLTGSTPFPEKRLRDLGYGEMQRVILEEEPERPSTRLSTMAHEQKAAMARSRSAEVASLSKLLRGDLDWVVMKCLEKDRTRRYDTANALAADIEHHLRQEPVNARPPSPLYRFQKLARRHNAAFAAAAAIAAVLVAGAGVSTWQAIRATEAERLAEASAQRATTETARAQGAEQSVRQQASVVEQQRQMLRRGLYVADMKLASLALDEGNLGRAVDLVQKYHAPGAGEEDLRGWEWRYLWQQSRGDEIATWPADDQEVNCVAFSPDGRLLATTGFSSKVNVWDATSKQLLVTLAGFTAQIQMGGLAFSPDGALLVAKSSSKLIAWDTHTWTARAQLETGNEFGRWAVAFSPDGKFLATTMHWGLRIWTTHSWQLHEQIANSGGAFDERLAYTRDGRFLAASGGGHVRLWDLERRCWAPHFAPPWKRGFGMAVSSNLLAAGDVHGTIKVWELASGRELASTNAHREAVHALAFSSDGALLATGAADQKIHLWDMSRVPQTEAAAAALEKIATLQGHWDEVGAVAFSPSGHRLASVGSDGAVKLWSVTQKPKQPELEGTWYPLGFLATGKRLLTVNDDHTLQEWDTATGRSLRRIESIPDGSAAARKVSWGWHVLAMDVSSDGTTLAVAIESDVRTNRAVELWDLVAVRRTAVWPLGEFAATKLVISQRGRWLAAAGKGEVRLFDLAEHRERAAFTNYPGTSGAARSVAFSPDESLLATAFPDNSIKLWEPSTARESATLPGHKYAAYHMTFSDDGALLATVAFDGARLWHVPSRRLLHALKGHLIWIRGVAFSPDGRTLATGAGDRVTLWNSATGQELLTLRKPGLVVNNLMFAPDGHTLAAGVNRYFDGRGPVELWRVPSLEEIEAMEQRSASSRSRVTQD
jgi:WD40 repeat protein/serine/threonine protein kinase